MIDYLSELISSIFYDRKLEYEKWRKIEYKLRLSLHLVISTSLICLLGLFFSVAIECFAIMCVASTMRYFQGNIHHSDNVDRCIIISMILILPPCVILTQLPIQYVLIISLFTHILMANRIPIGLNTTDSLSELRGYFRVYNGVLICTILAYLIGLHSVVYGLLIGSIISAINVSEDVINGLEWIDNKLSKWIKD